MNYLISSILAIAAAVAGYFWGLNQGQAKAQETQSQLDISRQTQQLGEHIQYLTLTQQNKLSDLEMLLKTRMVAQKVQLKALSETTSYQKNMVDSTVATADQLLQHPKDD